MHYNKIKQLNSMKALIEDSHQTSMLHKERHEVYKISVRSRKLQIKIYKIYFFILF